MKSDNSLRGRGRTTEQMKHAPVGAVFIWCNCQLHYPKELARKLNRSDLKIVSPDWLSHDRFRGLELTGIIIDHAYDIPERDRPCYLNALASIKPALRRIIK